MGVRVLPILAATLAIASLPADTTRSLLASTAATLLESAPFILAGSGLLAVSRRWGARLVPYLGCGCGAGPVARSLPAAIAVALAFGPLVAGARLAAAMLVARAVDRTGRECAHARAPLAQLQTIVPFGVAAAIAGELIAPRLTLAHLPHALAFAGGAVLGAVGTACALGAAGFAGAMRTSAPLVAAGFLCTSGIADLRLALRVRTHAPDTSHDACAYVIGALACGLVAVRRGDALVHPHFTFALACSAIAFASLAWRHRARRARYVWLAPAIMFAGAVLGAPAPTYRASETTLSDAFPGEVVDFTGEVTRSGAAVSLVRYAITCCRADAAPIVLRLESSPRETRGWMRARGTLVNAPDGLRLRVASAERIAPPADPFVYR